MNKWVDAWMEFKLNSNTHADVQVQPKHRGHRGRRQDPKVKQRAAVVGERLQASERADAGGCAAYDGAVISHRFGDVKQRHGPLQHTCASAGSGNEGYYTMVRV